MQLVEYIRIAQRDILEFSKDGNHKSPGWPDEYWPKEAAPTDKDSWVKTLTQIDDDLKTFIKLIQKRDL